MKEDDIGRKCGREKVESGGGIRFLCVTSAVPEKLLKREG